MSGSCQCFFLPCDRPVRTFAAARGTSVEDIFAETTKLGLTSLTRLGDFENWLDDVKVPSIERKIAIPIPGDAFEWKEEKFSGTIDDLCKKRSEGRPTALWPETLWLHPRNASLRDKLLWRLAVAEKANDRDAEELWRRNERDPGKFALTDDDTIWVPYPRPVLAAAFVATWAPGLFPFLKDAMGNGVPVQTKVVTPDWASKLHAKLYELDKKRVQLKALNDLAEGDRHRWMLLSGRLSLVVRTLDAITHLNPKASPNRPLNFAGDVQALGKLGAMTYAAMMSDDVRGNIEDLAGPGRAASIAKLVEEVDKARKDPELVSLAGQALREHDVRVQALDAERSGAVEERSIRDYAAEIAAHVHVELRRAPTGHAMAVAESEDFPDVAGPSVPTLLTVLAGVASSVYGNLPGPSSLMVARLQTKAIHELLALNSTAGAGSAADKLLERLKKGMGDKEKKALDEAIQKLQASKGLDRARAQAELASAATPKYLRSKWWPGVLSVVNVLVIAKTIFEGGAFSDEKVASTIATVTGCASGLLSGAASIALQSESKVLDGRFFRWLKAERPVARFAAGLLIVSGVATIVGGIRDDMNGLTIFTGSLEVLGGAASIAWLYFPHPYLAIAIGGALILATITGSWSDIEKLFESPLHRVVLAQLATFTDAKLGDGTTNADARLFGAACARAPQLKALWDGFVAQMRGSAGKRVLIQLPPTAAVKIRLREYGYRDRDVDTMTGWAPYLVPF